MIVPIIKENIPYRFEVELAREIFTFEVHYNSEHDFLTVDLEKNGEVLVYGSKLVYGEPLFPSEGAAGFPRVLLVPKDKAGKEDRVSYENLGETVFLFVGDVNV